MQLILALTIMSCYSKFIVNINEENENTQGRNLEEEDVFVAEFVGG